MTSSSSSSSAGSSTRPFVCGLLVGVMAVLLLSMMSPPPSPSPPSLLSPPLNVAPVAVTTVGTKQRTPESSPAASASCRWSFVAYHPSPLEVEWRKNIKTLKVDSCNFTMSPKYRPTLYDGVLAHQKSFVPNKVQAKLDQEPRTNCDVDRSTFPDMDALRSDAEVYSYFEYQNSCTKEVYKSPIEPLAGPLRHPRLCAPGWRDPDVIRHDWLAVDPWVVQNVVGDPATSRRRFFDAGSSTWYGDAVMGSSQVWFWCVFARWCLPFHSVHAWERSEFSPRRVYSGVPPYVRPFYHWYNIPAKTGERDGDNPLYHIASVATPDDYVVFKLDIDHTQTEEVLVDQLMANRTLLRLVDEFFWEHHVIFPSMQRAWGIEKGMKDQEATIAILAEMRREGVRAHSWV